MRHSTSTIAATACLKLIRALSSAGQDPAVLFSRLGLQASVCEDPEAQISYAQYCRLTHLTAEAVGDPHLGLTLARSARLEDLDVLGEVVRYSRTLGQAYQRLQRYYGIHTDSGTFRAEASDGVVTLVYEPVSMDAEERRFDDEFTVAMMVHAGRQLCRQQWLPIAVQFQHQRPHDLVPYRQLFGVTPTFSCDRISFSLVPEVLEMPTLFHNPRLEGSVESMAEELLQRRPGGDPWLAGVKSELERSLLQGDYGAAILALKLGLSLRSLQRRLNENGTSYSDLLEQVRRDLATRYLSTTQHSQTDIAFFLGYSEVSAYVRAFRRWEGIGPTEYRDRAVLARNRV